MNINDLIKVQSIEDEQIFLTNNANYKGYFNIILEKEISLYEC